MGYANNCSDTNTNNLAPHWFESIVRLILLPYLALIFILTVRGGWKGYIINDQWKTGDWLINYQGGLIRRGFSGEAIFQLSLLTDVNPGLYIFAIQLICYFLFFTFSYLLLKKQHSLLPYMFLLASPFLFVFQLHDFQGGYRKEIIYFAFLAFIAWASTSCHEQKFERLYFATLLFYPFVILTHEMLAIFLPYLVIIYVSKIELNLRRALTNLVFLSGSLFSLFISIYQVGNVELITAICESLGENAPLKCEVRGAIASLIYSASEGSEFILKRISESNYLAGYSGYVALSSLAYIFVLDKIKVVFQNWVSRALLFVSIIGTIGLFSVGIDWGRFIYIHLVSLFILSLLPQKTGLYSSLKKTVSPFYSSIIHGRYFLTDRRLCTALFAVFLMLTMFYSQAWQLPHAYK